MIHNEDKHSTKEFRCEEFRKIGLNDNQIEKVEKIISEYYLDCGIQKSKEKMKTRFKKSSKVLKDICELKKSLLELERFDKCYYNDLNAKVGSMIINYMGMIAELETEARKWMPVLNHNFKVKSSKTNSYEILPPLKYLGVMERFFQGLSVPNSKKVLRTTPFNNSFKIYSTSAVLSKKKGAPFFYHHPAYEKLTTTWESVFGKKISKYDESNFFILLSIILYGNSESSNNARIHYRKYKEEPLDSISIPVFKKVNNKNY